MRSSWQLLAAAPDNRTFVLSGWTGPDSPIRLFRVTLGDDGRPGAPVPVPGFEGDASAPGHALAVSPDGTRIAYATTVVGGGAKVSVVDVATGLRRDWSTRVSPVVSGLSWAPDGRRIALVVMGWGVGVLDLERQDTDLLAAARLVRPAGGVPLLHSVAYTHGDVLVYSAGHTIERVPAGGGEPQTLARVPMPPGASATLRFSLDGTGGHLLCTHGWQGFRVDLADGSTVPVPLTGGERPGRGDPHAAW
nr:hypothetical protein GCM10020093_036750 [Planobispora longispora]